MATYHWTNERTILGKRLHMTLLLGLSRQTQTGYMFVTISVECASTIQITKLYKPYVFLK